jgi:HEAT repeat protein
MINSLLLIPLVVLFGDDPRDRPPADALRLTARAIKSSVELGEAVPFELTFTNDGIKPLSVNLHAAARCTCDFACSWGGGQAGPTSPADEHPSKSDEWRRLKPGESVSVRVTHESVSTKVLGPLTLKFQYRPQAGQSPPNDWYEGVRESDAVKIQVVDPDFLRKWKADPDNRDLARAVAIKLLETLEAEGPWRGIDSIRPIIESNGVMLVEPVAKIAADRSLRGTLRAKACNVLGSCVYYAATDQQPRLRETALPVLEALVTDDFAEVRRQAVSALRSADWNRPHFEKIDALLNDPNEDVRRRAADYLTGFLHHKDAWPLIEIALRSDSRVVRDVMTQAHTLKYPAGHADVDLLLRCCLTADDALCLTLLAGLDKSVAARDVPALGELFAKKSAAVQVKAIELAGRTAGIAREELIARALTNEHAEVRKAALDAIERSRDDSFAAALREFVAKASDPERERGRRILAQFAREFPFPDVKKLLAEILPPAKPRPTAEQVIQAAVRSAGRDAESVNLLFVLDDPDAVALVRPLLDSKVEVLRAAACKFLGRVRDDESFERMVQLTNDPSDQVRRTAAQAIAAYGRVRAALPLFRLLDDQELEVREAARYLLPSVAGGLSVDELRRVFIRVGNSKTWAAQREPLAKLAAERGPAAVAVLIELLDPPDGVEFRSAVIEPLQQASGHSIAGNYEDPAERRRLAARWREWWKTADLRPPTPVQAPREPAGRGPQIVIELLPQQPQGSGLVVRASISGSGDMASRVVPVSDEGVEEYFQYAIFEDGQEIERGDVTRELVFHRYSMIPFGSVASVGGWSGMPFTITPHVKPGEYEVHIEARYLRTERVGGVPVRDSFGPRLTESSPEVFTLKSNRLRFTQRAIEDAVPAKPASRAQGRIKEPKTIAELATAATAEPGSQGWSWFTSREALESLDGQLGAEHAEHANAFAAELAGRLISRRDRFTMRGGESLWGAYRTAFLLGCLGNKKAIGVLEQARQSGDPKDDLNRSQCVLLRWYAMAALKLIDVQDRPAAERTELVKAWLKHCFSSPEEHFMARSRLLPFLNQLLDPRDRAEFYRGLMPTLSDPWMIHDAKKFTSNES